MSHDPNREVIEEFRANGGAVDRAMGGYFKDRPLLILHATGAKTGAERIKPLTYLGEGDRRYVFATKGGSPENPDWYHNVKAHPAVTVEVGDESYPATATEITGAERDRIYAEQVAAWPAFGDYQRKTTRTIPVIALDRA